MKSEYLSRHGQHSFLIDVNGCSNWDDFHEVIQKGFGFPEYYGKNWDAMWDCLDGFFMQDEEQVIRITGFSGLPESLKVECEPMWQIFRELQKEYPKLVIENRE